MILTNQNYLNYTREELNLLGFSNDDINSVVYGETKFLVKHKEKLQNA